MRHRMFVRRTVTVVIGLMLATLAVAVPPAAAAAPGPGTATGETADPAIAAALQRIATNTQSPADLALIRSRPELAAVAPDPTQVTFTTSVDQAAPVETGPATKGVGAHPNIVVTNACGWIEIRITAYTLLGFRLFAWTHHVGFCTDYETIRRWTARYDRMDYADPTITMLDRKVDSVTRTPTFSATSTIQRHLQQCVLTYGCWANWYPWSTITIYPDSTFDWSWGVG